MKKVFVILSAFTFAALLPMVGYAADNGCSEDSGNDYINQAIALCSTHAYNIDDTKNPTSAADKQMMADAIALKTTIITQQMKRQYDFLDVTMKRLKTQMEKSILTAKVQAAGGNATEESKSASGTSSSFRNCSGLSRSESVSCLRENNRKYIELADNRNIDSAAKTQIERDASIIDSLAGIKTVKDACQKNKITKSRNDASTANCLNEISAGIIAIEDKEREANKTGK